MKVKNTYPENPANLVNPDSDQFVVLILYNDSVSDFLRFFCQNQDFQDKNDESQNTYPENPGNLVNPDSDQFVVLILYNDSVSDFLRFFCLNQDLQDKKDESQNTYPENPGNLVNPDSDQFVVLILYNDSVLEKCQDIFSNFFGFIRLFRQFVVLISDEIS